MKKHLLRFSTLCLLVMMAIVGRAESITATWDFTNKDVVAEAIEDAFDTYGRYLGLTATVFSSVVGVASATLFQLRI